MFLVRICTSEDSEVQIWIPLKNAFSKNSNKNKIFLKEHIENFPNFTLNIERK